jgi:Na+/alanine symporter
MSKMQGISFLFFMGFSCILCFKYIVKHNERYLVQGKGTFNVLEELRKLPFRVNLCYSGYICKHCLYNLKKRAGLIRQLLEILIHLLLLQTVFSPLSLQTAEISSVGGVWIFSGTSQHCNNNNIHVA